MAAEGIPEQHFGKYRLLGVMSAGGMAELFLALQAGPEGFSKVVALKRVLPHLAESHDFVQMFMDEARLAARLDHPNIVRIYDFGEASGQYFMAMEYLPGEDLFNVLWRARKAGQAVPPEIAAYIAQAAAEGLHFAHELTDADGQPLGLVHRDANPTNILVTFQGVVKVVDFGIAKAMGNVNQTRFGQVKGKASYLAPEQVYAEAALDRRVDVFCLGIVLWETLTGQRLFARDNDMASAQASVTFTPPPPGQVRPGLPPELDAITLKALAKRPEQRFQTAGELQDALEGYLRRGAVRPTSKEIVAWMEGLFGPQRAEAKRAIAQGRNLKTAIPLVMRPLVPATPARPGPPVPDPAPRATPFGVAQPSVTVPSAGPATDAATVPLPPHALPPGRPPIGRRAALAGVLLALAGALLWGGNRLARELGAQRSERAAPAPTAALELESTPPGAFVFLGGEPTGQFTPTRLAGLGGEPVAVRLELAGYEAARETVELQPGATVRRSFVLEPQPALLSVRGVPEGAGLLVDGEPSPPNRTLTLTPGQHVLQLEVAGKPSGSPRTIELKPGEQRTVEMP